jgi:hypothetical protein
MAACGASLQCIPVVHACNVCLPTCHAWLSILLAELFCHACQRGHLWLYIYSQLRKIETLIPHA